MGRAKHLSTRAAARAGALAGACLLLAAGASAASARAVISTSSARSLPAALIASSAPSAPSTAGAPAHAPAPGPTSSGKPAAAATLEQCLGAAAASERSATFAGEINAIPGTQRMQISIELQEQLPTDASFHLVALPGLAAWRSSTPGVQSYKYLRQVTNLAAPAFYRATIHFRWLGAKGRLIAATELHTRRCEQRAPVLAGG